MLLPVIEWKRDGQVLDAAHWGRWIEGMLEDQVRPYHQAALNVAVAIRGLSPDERGVLYGLLAAEGVLPERLEVSDIGLDRALYGGERPHIADPVHPILRNKIAGQELSEAEIARFVEGVTDGSVRDEQIAAFTMAVYLRGMSRAETVALTLAMLHSGDVLSWEGAPGPVVDKHSTGGVGDKVSLPLAGSLIALGLCVPMLSGRGLGHTGGTLDKLESIPGYRTNLDNAEIQRLVRTVGGMIIGQTSRLAPADKRIYSIRDVTGTVSSIPLITASILSKKLAEGLNALVLDVKVGDGAFMKTLPDARRLARSLVEVGTAAGVQVRALLTSMDEPIGAAIGNANEVSESVACLRGEGPADLEALVVALGAELLLATGRATDQADAEAQVAATLHDGRAAAAFERMVEAQGGDTFCLQSPAMLPGAKLSSIVSAPSAGFITQLRAETLGRAVVALGGGRRAAEDPVDHGVGIRVLHRVGDVILAGQPVLQVLANDPRRLREGVLLAEQALQIEASAPVLPPLILERLVFESASASGSGSASGSSSMAQSQGSDCA